MAALSFSTFFQALWGYDPFPWQAALAERVAGASWPSVLDLPTASGKTACIDIALFALAAQADRPTAQRTAPRRVWFVVDRRIVVDEAFERAKQIAAKLADARSGPLKEVADRLCELASTDRPVAVARLRGGVFRDDGWARLPSQPAVITSTVDQLGSRLLFRGYGHGLLAAPIYAGLAANDSLILLDEAHCSVPFQQTLRAIQRFRSRPWAEQPLETPFGFVVLSATPPPDVPPGAVFPGLERGALLDHPTLHQRLRASKPAELVVVKARKDTRADPLITEAARRAGRYIEQGKVRVAVMVNRVRTAIEIAATLEDSIGERAEIVLLTGRLRPFDRDALLERWTPFLRADRPEVVPKPVVVVSTQCLEVGADFSFDALVTEMASLDALRQRFGRLDRMGTAGTSPAIILVRDRDTDPAKASPDPIYGLAIANTWALLSERAIDGVVDFGVEKLQAMLEGIDDVTPYIAPPEEAPVLLPAHLDLLCQTAPPPAPEPHVQIFLHGKDRGMPEVQVVWRSDLVPGQPRGVWLETVALCPPVSGEMLPVPLYQLRAFLALGEEADPGGDVEGVGGAEAAEIAGKRAFLLWRGRDRSVVTDDPRHIRPGEVVVLPASYGFGSLGQPPVEDGCGEERLDIWERTLSSAGKRPAIRLTPATLAAWMACPPVHDLLEAVRGPEPDREQVDTCISAILDYEPGNPDAASPPPQWWRELLSDIRAGELEAHPGGGVVLFGKRPAHRAEEPDLFADDDDLLSAAGHEVPHDAHADLVRRTAGRMARACLGDHYVAVFEAAADWHDVGKLDERFQVVLHQGDEIAAITAPAPLAKSASIPASPARRRAIRDAAGLPEGYRHEMVSVQVAERYALAAVGDMAELFLHLIASHHGHARPFAPVVLDPAPPAIAGSRNGIPFELSSVERQALTPPHRVDSGVADRFWRLVRRHGWWGLAYLEAIFRLSDWYASAWTASNAAQREPAVAGPGLQEEQS